MLRRHEGDTANLEMALAAWRPGNRTPGPYGRVIRTSSEEYQNAVRVGLGEEISPPPLPKCHLMPIYEETIEGGLRAAADPPSPSRYAGWSNDRLGEMRAARKGLLGYGDE
ncbi:hypothetical protein BU15DRAFT_62148 [Melanogaster broomeanus]|nr:hypothetical protein BU15DRAFT_62148 [Melanogaster broomeanus]